jgi:hypothetical protein
MTSRFSEGERSDGLLVPLARAFWCGGLLFRRTVS